MRNLAAMQGWKPEAEFELDGHKCQAYVVGVPRSDTPTLVDRYRAYLDADGWLRGLDLWTWDQGEPGALDYVHRVRYRNLKLNPTVPASTFTLPDANTYKTRNY